MYTSNMKFENPEDKWAVLREIKDELVMKHGFVMDDVDEQKPWGAYYRFTLDQKQKFLDLFFSDLDPEHVPGNINPKFLVFAPGQKVSMQYHDRRDEIWTVLHGELEAWFGPEDEVGEYTTYKTGDTFSYPAPMRHKGGASQKGWAVVAEIWRHTDQDNLSTEADIVRVSDDYGRA